MAEEKSKIDRAREAKIAKVRRTQIRKILLWIGKDGIEYATQCVEIYKRTKPGSATVS